MEHYDQMRGIIAANVLGSVASVADLFSGNAATRTVVWAEAVESLTLAANRANTEARIIEARFVIGTESNATNFQTVACPRAPGDYLLTNNAYAEPLPGSTRLTRAKISSWGGLSSVIAPTN